MPILCSIPLKPFPLNSVSDIWVSGWEVASPASSRGVLKKFDTSGTLLSTITYASDRPTAFTLERDGNATVTTNAYPYVNTNTCYIRKYDVNLSSIWTTTETAANLFDICVGLDDPGITYVLKYNTSVVPYTTIRKYDIDGNLITTFTFTSSTYVVEKIFVDYGGNIYINDNASRIRKYSSAGTSLLTVTLPDQVNDIVVDGDSNIYAVTDRVGSVNSLYKINSSGTTVWSKNHGDALNALYLDVNDNIYACGQLSGAVTTRKYNSAGTLLLSYSYGGEATHMQVDNNGNSYVGYDSGEANQLKKYNSSGTLQWETTIGATYIITEIGILNKG